VLDKDGEECKSFVISSIDQSNPGLVTVHEEKRHSYEDGDHVTFREVEGMTELNGKEPMPIQVVSPFTFKICDTTGFSAYTGNGTVDQVKVPREHTFKSWAEAVEEPLCPPDNMLAIPDLGKFGRSE